MANIGTTGGLMSDFDRIIFCIAKASNYDLEDASWKAAD